ncbi:hypothetical protein BC332_00966 [Capsicum chinense]|nr:hypothetical protein BC332_00966 [Capsicum chinense]
MSDVLPKVISEILTQLPVKALMKFRCVSQSFKSLIDNPKFAEAHLNQQTLKPNTNTKLILKDHNLLLLDFSSICNGASNQQPIELEHLLKQLYHATQVLGSCRGLIFTSNNLNDNVALWNLPTKMFRKLPIHPVKPPSRIPQGHGIGLVEICGGFGYDDSDNDYKVVTTPQRYYPYDQDQPSLVSEVMVYSLKLGVWKKVQDYTYWLHTENNGTFAGGGPPYKSNSPRAIWNPPLTRQPSPQPKFAARLEFLF